MALDTNLLVYAEGLNGPERQAEAETVISGLSHAEVVLPVQVLSELFFVLVRKARRPAAAARATVLDWAQIYSLVDTDPLVLSDAMALAIDHRVAWWDAIVMASALNAECDLLLSEEFQDGFVWRGLTVRNPLTTPSR